MRKENINATEYYASTGGHVAPPCGAMTTSTQQDENGSCKFHEYFGPLFLT